MPGKKKCGAPSLRDCAYCGAPEGSIPGIKKHLACGRCLITYYCSTKCQKQHWKAGGHKWNCVAPADRRVTGNVDGGGAAAGEAAAEEPECAICLEGISTLPLQTLPCSHVFHQVCVERLLSFGINQACPMCRAELPPGPEKLHDDAVRRWVVLHQRYGCGDESWRRVSSARDRRELDEVMQMLHSAAEQKYATAQFNLGAMYFHGSGVAQNYVTAEDLFRKAADQGSKQAQCNLGIMYARGKVVVHSDAMAVEWFRKAAEQGYEQAQYNIGMMYLFGKGVDQSDAMAEEWFRKAAEQGHEQAQSNLKRICAEGQVITLI